MPAKKIKVDSGPSASGIALAAALNCTVGIALGFAFLSSFPAMMFSSADELARYQASEEYVAENKPGSRYYLKTQPNRSRSWEAKRNQLLQGSGATLSIASSEINAWMASRFIPPSVDDVQGSVTIAPGTPNFAAESEEQIFISIPIAIRAFGTRYDRTFFAKGHFTEGAPVRFILDEASVDCAKIPFSPLYTAMYQRLHDAFRFTDEYKLLAEAWQGVESVKVSNGALNLRLR